MMMKTRSLFQQIFDPQFEVSQKTLLSILTKIISLLTDRFSPIPHDIYIPSTSLVFKTKI